MQLMAPVTSKLLHARLNYSNAMQMQIQTLPRATESSSHIANLEVERGK